LSKTGEKGVAVKDRGKEIGVTDKVHELRRPNRAGFDVRAGFYFIDRYNRTGHSQVQLSIPSGRKTRKIFIPFPRAIHILVCAEVSRASLAKINPRHGRDVGINTGGASHSSFWGRYECRSLLGSPDISNTKSDVGHAHSRNHSAS
jgi:hypothetical protein